jgi:hypothetical protein
MHFVAGGTQGGWKQIYDEPSHPSSDPGYNHPSPGCRHCNTFTDIAEEPNETEAKRWVGIIECSGLSFQGMTVEPPFPVTSARRTPFY